MPTLAADMNTRLHSLHTYFLSLLWTSVCRFMCSRRVNFLPQMSQG